MYSRARGKKKAVSYDFCSSLHTVDIHKYNSHCHMDVQRWTQEKGTLWFPEPTVHLSLKWFTMKQKYIAKVGDVYRRHPPLVKILGYHWFVLIWDDNATLLLSNFSVNQHSVKTLSVFFLPIWTLSICSGGYCLLRALCLCTRSLFLFQRVDAALSSRAAFPGHCVHILFFRDSPFFFRENCRCCVQRWHPSLCRLSRGPLGSVSRWFCVSWAFVLLR